MRATASRCCFSRVRRGPRFDGRIGSADAAAGAAGARLIVVERPGYGLSDRQPQRRAIEWADDVRAFADALGLERFAVYGYSGGGPHALACAARLGDRVTAVATISGVPPAASLRMLTAPVGTAVRQTKGLGSTPMPAAVYFGGGTVLFVEEEPEAVVSAFKREANGWTVLRDLDGEPATVFGERVCFVGSITSETLADDHVLAGKVRRALGGS